MYVKMLKRLKNLVLYPLFILSVIILVVFLAVNLLTSPSNDRDWLTDQTILAHAEIQKDFVTIKNIRNFSYASTTSYAVNYYDKTFDLNKIKKVWYIVEPFSGIPGSAHTFLSFEFEGNEFVSISVEIRKEKGESFSPIRGLFNQYELIYIIADERDAIKLRSNYRKDLVYVYPVKTSKEKIRELFVDMLERANELKENPEFYNTIVNNCTTNIAVHVNEIATDRIPLLNLRLVFPENSDRLAYELGLLDTDLTFEEARERYFINDRALMYADDPDFSIKIRQEN